MASHVKRIVRVRPMTDSEKTAGAKPIVSVENEEKGQNGTGTQICLTHAGRQEVFDFYSCYRSSTPDEAPLYEDVGHYVVANALDRAFGTCLITYGRSSAGASYSVFGSDNNSGLFLTTLNTLFERAASDEYKAVQRYFFLSFYELRNDFILDLQAPDIVSTVKPSIQDLTFTSIKSLQDARRALESGMARRRTIAEQRGNSPAHLITTITVESRAKQGAHISCTIDFLVLAGSEMCDLKGPESDHLRLSYSALARILNGISQSQTTGLPYKQFGLTRLLQEPYETGRYRIILLCLISPTEADYEHTVRSLSFCARGVVLPPRSPSSGAGLLSMEQRSQASELELLYAYVSRLTRALEAMDKGLVPPKDKVILSGVTTLLPPDRPAATFPNPARCDELAKRIQQIDNFFQRCMPGGNNSPLAALRGIDSLSLSSPSPGSLSPTHAPGSLNGGKVLPLERKRRAGAQPRGRRSRQPGPDLLLVEDVRPPSQRVAEGALKRTHYKLEMVNDGEAAMEKFRKIRQSLRVVLMDIHLPGMNGIEATERIRAWEQAEMAKEVDAEPAIIILGLIGNAEEGNANAAAYRAAGMDGCLVKSKALERTLKHALDLIENSTDETAFVNLCNDDEHMSDDSDSAFGNALMGKRPSPSPPSPTRGNENVSSLADKYQALMIQPKETKMAADSGEPKAKPKERAPFSLSSIASTAPDETMAASSPSNLDKQALGANSPSKTQRDKRLFSLSEQNDSFEPEAAGDVLTRKTNKPKKSGGATLGVSKAGGQADPDLLLVEDVRVSQKIAHAALKRAHYKVECADDGESSVAKFKKFHASLKIVLMDINLPGISGIEATRQIRAFEAQENLQPCIILGLTGDVEQSNLHTYEQVGMDGCIVKGQLIEESVKRALALIEEKPDTFVNLTSPVDAAAARNRSPRVHPTNQKSLDAKQDSLLKMAAQPSASAASSMVDETPQPSQSKTSSLKDKYSQMFATIKPTGAAPGVAPLPAAATPAASAAVAMTDEADDHKSPSANMPAIRAVPPDSPQSPAMAQSRLLALAAGVKPEIVLKRKFSGKVTPKPGKPSRSGGPDLLLVEDVRVSQKIANAALKRAHYRVELADDGESAVDKYKKHMGTLKIVLMDINLPGMSGIEATEQIRGYEEKEHHEPCVVLGLTGNVDEDNLVAYQQVGMDGCILKGKLLEASVKQALTELEARPDLFVNLSKSDSSNDSS